MSDASDDPCGPVPTDRLGLRIASVFVILVTSLCGTLFPILAKRVPALRRTVPGVVFEFAKYFGSGVILATGFIHLLEPAADDELSESNTISNGGCISDKWADYPFAFGICLASLFVTFVIQIVAFRLGTDYLTKRGLSSSVPHAGITEQTPQQDKESPNDKESPSIPQGDTESLSKNQTKTSTDEYFADASEETPAIPQILGVALLEFGVVFHSIIIGLTLAVSGADEFTTLFIVIIFHQMFEGLGLGTRLAFLKLPGRWSWIPYAGAMVYSFVTPLGIAIGLGVREGLSMSSGSASVAAGVLDSISAGVLIYTATVELMAHEFVFNTTYHRCSWGKLWFSIISFAAGAGIMALLGKWA